MKTIPYTRLNAKNKSRVDTAVNRYENKPSVLHHSVISTRTTKHVRSIVTVCDPTTELNLILGGKLRITQISI